MLLDRKSFAKGVKFAPGCALLAAHGASTPSLSQLPEKQLIPAQGGWDMGLDLNNAQGLSAQQIGGKDPAKDKHKTFRLPLKDDLVINKQTAVAEGVLERWRSLPCRGKMSVVRKRHLAEVKTINYVLWWQVKSSSCTW